jgi:hypothetical protein
MLRAVVLAGAAAVVAACGSTSHVNGSAAKASHALELARCMRAHGVPNFPDPGPGGGLELTPGSGINPQSPSFQSAQRACRRYLPTFAHPGTMSAAERQRAVSFARCMRSHGEPDFPDPTLGAATPATTGRVLALRGMFFAIGPGIDPKSPAFRHAAGDCGVTGPLG